MTFPLQKHAPISPARLHIAALFFISRFHLFTVLQKTTNLQKHIYDIVFNNCFEALHPLLPPLS